jgi:hypothetical protein
LLQYGQAASITLLTQFKDCQTTEIFYGIDNRLSDLAFSLGTASNIGTQIGTTVFYYFMSSTASDSTIAYASQDTFGMLFMDTAYYKLISQIVDYYNSSDYQNIGLVLGSFFKSIINFSSPNTST